MFFAGGFVLCLAGIVLTILILVIPNWTQMDLEVTSSSLQSSDAVTMVASWGLFEACGKVSGLANGQREGSEHCHSIDSCKLGAVVALTIAGLVGTVLSSVGIWAALYRLTKESIWNVHVWCFCIVLAGLVTITGAIVFATTFYQDLNNAVSSAPVSKLVSQRYGSQFNVISNGLRLNWPFYVCIVAGCCEVLAAIFFNVGMRRKIKADSVDSKVIDSVPHSAPAANKYADTRVQELALDTDLQDHSESQHTDGTLYLNRGFITEEKRGDQATSDPLYYKSGYNHESRGTSKQSSRIPDIVVHPLYDRESQIAGGPFYDNPGFGNDGGSARNRRVWTTGGTDRPDYRENQMREDPSYYSSDYSHNEASAVAVYYPNDRGHRMAQSYDNPGYNHGEGNTWIA